MHTISTYIHCGIPLECTDGTTLSDGCASAESWCATLHQAVPCAQREDVVVAHQPGGGVYFANQFTPAREGKCRQLECMLERCGGMHFVVAHDWLSNYRQDGQSGNDCGIRSVECVARAGDGG